MLEECCCKVWCVLHCTMYIPTCLMSLLLTHALFYPIGGKGTPTSVIMIVVVTLVAVAAVVAPCVIIPSAYVGRQKYNARRYG